MNQSDEEDDCEYSKEEKKKLLIFGRTMSVIDEAVQEDGDETSMFNNSRAFNSFIMMQTE